MTISITLIGGPTALIEIDGFRLLTDPTFDAPGAYQLPHVKLEKLTGPALAANDIGEVDAVLLSHDQHSDNLDHSGGISRARQTRADDGSRRKTARRPCGRSCAVGGHRTDRQERSFADDHRDAGASRPGRHRAAVRRRHRLRADVEQAGSRPVYISGDTVWFDGVAEVARRFKAGVVLPFAGAAQTRGPFHLTMDTNDTIETARAFPDAVIVPVHTDGWAHFRQSAGDLRASFDTLGFGARLKILEPGVATVIEP